MNHIQEARNAARYTQQEVADRIGISRVSYARYESGLREPNLSTLNDIADFLGVTVDYLIGRTTQEETPTQKEPEAQPDPQLNEVIQLIQSLTPEELQRVHDFAAGVKSRR